MSKSNFHILATAASAETAAAPVPGPSVWAEQQHGFRPRPERVQKQRRPAVDDTIPETAETAATPVPSPSVRAEQQHGFHPRPERGQTQRRPAVDDTISEAA